MVRRGIVMSYFFRVSVIAASLFLCGGVPAFSQGEILMQGLAPPARSQPSFPDWNQKIQTSPADADAYKGRAGAYRKAGMRAHAVDDINQALSINKNDAGAYLMR